MTTNLKASRQSARGSGMETHCASGDSGFESRPLAADGQREQVIQTLFECATEIVNLTDHRNPVAARAVALARRLDGEEQR